MNDGAKLFGLPLQDWSELFMSMGIALLVLGIALRLILGDFGSQAEEDVKNRSVNSERAKVVVKRKVWLLNMSIVLGIIFLSLGVVALLLLADAAVVPSHS